MRHELKTWPVHFDRVVDGSKTFEVRKDDRGYQTGDTLVLREWDPAAPGYTGHVLEVGVGFIFRRGFGLDCGEYVVMSLVPLDALLLQDQP